MGWPIFGSEKTVAAFSRDDLKSYMGANYRAGGMMLIAVGRGRPCAARRCGRDPVPASDIGRRCPRLCPRASSAAISATSEDLEQAHLAFAFPGVVQHRSRCGDGADLRHRAGRRHVLAPVPGSAREARPLLRHLRFLAIASRHRASIGIYAGTGEDKAGEVAAAHRRRDRSHGQRRDRGRSRARPRPVEGLAADGAGEPGRALRADCRPPASISAACSRPRK